jgi:polyphosphate kinase
LRDLDRNAIGISQMSPTEQLTAIHKVVVKQQKKHEELFSKLEAELEEQDIHFVNEKELSKSQSEFVKRYFKDKIRPLLVPIMLKGRATDLDLNDNSIYLAIKLWNKDNSQKPSFALVEVPRSVPRFLVLPEENGKKFVMFLDDVIRLKMHKIFSIFDFDSIEAYTLKITRDAELDIDDDISQSLIEKMTKSVDKRKSGQYVRFIYDKQMPEDILNRILKKLDLDSKIEDNIIPGGKYHNKRDLMGFPDFGDPSLTFKYLPPASHHQLSNKKSLLDAVSEKDVLLHYPYQRFSYVVDLLREAAIDPDVRTIRINIYRVAPESQVCNALINAVKNGKKVTVVIELLARFDEENNIEWSEELQEEGVKVIFGVPGLKVHSKLILISRKENGKTRRYAHIGTGNFHEKTARIYSDTSLITARKELANEVRKVFRFFENNYERAVFRHLIVSPFSTRRRFIKLINNEIKAAQQGKEAWIIIKLNNLVDESMIKKLYDASNAGVNIRLIIRGVCSLVPGVKGLSENISVTSIVGRFLEHSRILIFANQGDPKYYISSADWMSRNLDIRIEVSAPVYDPALQQELMDFIQIQLRDNAKARIVNEAQDNQYVIPQKGEDTHNSQEELYQYFKNKVESIT